MDINQLTKVLNKLPDWFCVANAAKLLKLQRIKAIFLGYKERKIAYFWHLSESGSLLTLRTLKIKSKHMG